MVMPKASNSHGRATSKPVPAPFVPAVTALMMPRIAMANPAGAMPSTSMQLARPSTSRGWLRQTSCNPQTVPVKRPRVRESVGRRLSIIPGAVRLALSG